MQLKKITTPDPDFYYYQSGEDPKLLIHTGTHGDEYQVIDFVYRAVNKYLNNLPALIFVPRVSPSAVKKKTRVNSSGLDVNRIFTSVSKEKEVLTNIKIINNQKFDLFVSIHEDPESWEYYLYDIGYGNDDSQLLLKYSRFLKKSGVKLLNGCDDPDDPSLGYEFKEGYHKFVHKKGEKDNGMVPIWLLNRHLAKDCFLPEIPGKLSLKKKEEVVDSFFTRVIVKYFQSL